MKRLERVGVCLLAIFCLWMLLTTPVPPNGAVHAQNAGVVGLYTKLTPVFSAQASSTSSAILPDNGFADNVLTFCNTGFQGSIDLEWQPATGAAFLPIVRANYPNPDSNCHSLQAGGYYPNMRSTVSITLGSVSAWFTGASGPIATFPAALSTAGATSPIVCDRNNDILVLSGATSPVASPLLSGDTVVICNIGFSFSATPTGTALNLGWYTTTACTGSVSFTWQSNVTSATPIYELIGMQQRTIAQSLPVACVVNTSGVSLIANVNWASVQGL